MNKVIITGPFGVIYPAYGQLGGWGIPSLGESPNKYVKIGDYYYLVVQELPSWSAESFNVPPRMQAPLIYSLPYTRY